MIETTISSGTPKRSEARRTASAFSRQKRSPSRMRNGSTKRAR
jgi:hypothetical protein